MPHQGSFESQHGEGRGVEADLCCYLAQAGAEKDAGGHLAGRCVNCRKLRPCYAIPRSGRAKHPLHALESEPKRFNDPSVLDRRGRQLLRAYRLQVCSRLLAEDEGG